MTQESRVTGMVIIETVIEAMRAGTEPLAYSALAPSHYHIHLHTEDHERLSGIFPRIVVETKRKLDRELERMNEGGGVWGRVRRLWSRAEEQFVYESADGDWYITFHENADDELEAGAFDVSVELALPAKNDACGTKTKVITMRRNAEGATRKIRETVESLPPDAGADAAAAGTSTGERPPVAPAEPAAYARLSYEDDGGRQVYSMTKNQIVIGRGGVDYWVDVRVNTAGDVSREHLRLRRDPRSGKFYLKDMSTYGTTLDGLPVRPSVEVIDGQKQDRNFEIELPLKARIGLAGVLDLDFEATEAP